MTRSGGLTFAVLPVVLTALFAQPVVAKQEPPPAPPPPLTGQTLTSTVVDESGDCSNSGGANLSYTTTGTSGPPYVGTFTETGAYTGGPFFGLVGAVTTFVAEFRIDSPLGQVTGTKHLVLPSALTRQFQCAFARQASVFGLRYEATIETPDGRRYRDRGISNVVVGDVDGFGPGGSPFEFLSEYFLSDLAAPELICEKLKEHKNDPDKSKCKDDDH